MYAHSHKKHQIVTLLPYSPPQPILSLQAFPHLRGAQEVRLAKGHALLPQNVVRSRDMEEEVGDDPVRNVDGAGELEIPARDRNGDLDLLLALEIGLLALDVAEELQGTLDALLQLVDRGLVVLDGHPFVAGNAVEHCFGNVAGELNLELEGLHGIDKPGVDQLLGGNIVLLGPGLALLDVVGELGQAADEERDAYCCC